MHSHSNCHSHKRNYNFKFGIGILLNTIFCIIELYYGKRAGSASLVADALHNFMDIIGLIVSWSGFFLGNFKSSKKFTFGLRKATIVASFSNAIILLIGVCYLLVESVEKIMTQQPVAGLEVMIVAGIGIIINATTALLFFSDSKNDLNIKSAFIHMLIDAVVSVGVILVGLIIVLTNFYLIDAIMGFIISIIIVVTTWSLFTESVKLMFGGVPSNISVKRLEDILASIKEIRSFHDLHIWAISTNEASISLHVVVLESTNKSAILSKLQRIILEEFKISHITIQIETENEVKCNVSC